MALASQPEVIAAAQAGRLVSFPTDTVPALAAKPEQAAIIYAAKQRAATKPLILMAAEAEALWPYVESCAKAQAAWQEMAAAYWPGALTLVLPASGLHPRVMTPQESHTLGIRVPDSSIARAILAETGPLATTSANRSGEPALTRVEAIAQAFPQATVLQTSTSIPSISLTACAALEAEDSSPRPSTVIAWSAPSAVQSALEAASGATSGTKSKLKSKLETSPWKLLRQGSVVIAGLT